MFEEIYLEISELRFMKKERCSNNKHLKRRARRDRWLERENGARLFAFTYDEEEEHREEETIKNGTDTSAEERDERLIESGTERFSIMETGIECTT